MNEFMTKTAPTDLAGAIGVVEEIAAELFAEVAEMESIDAGSAETDEKRRKGLALTLILDAVRGYEAMREDRDKWLSIAQRLFKQRQILVHGHEYEDKYDNEILKAIREKDVWPDMVQEANR